MFLYILADFLQITDPLLITADHFQKQIGAFHMTSSTELVGICFCVTLNCLKMLENLLETGRGFLYASVYCGLVHIPKRILSNSNKTNAKMIKMCLSTFTDVLPISGKVQVPGPVKNSQHD